MGTPREHLASMAAALSKLPPHKNPLHPQGRAAGAARSLSPQARAKLGEIASDPQLTAVATNGVSGSSAGSSSTASATDPTGASKGRGREGADLGWGSGFGHMRKRNVRHVLLGITALALTAGQANANWKATPLVGFKPDKLTTLPGFSGTVSAIQSGVRPQYVNQAAEDTDMYQPLSYGGELDLDAVDAAVSITGFVTNGNATAAQTFYGAFIGEATGVPYRAFTSKLQVGSLGTSGSVSANGTGSLVLTPLIEYTTRKIILTPGASFSDAFIITSVTCGIQNQLMSGDPIPASVFSDLYPLFIDFDPCKPAVPLTVNYTNVSAGSATLKGSTRGDCDPADLAKYGGSLDVAA